MIAWQSFGERGGFDLRDVAWRDRELEIRCYARSRAGDLLTILVRGDYPGLLTSYPRPCLLFPVSAGPERMEGESTDRYVMRAMAGPVRTPCRCSSGHYIDLRRVGEIAELRRGRPNRVVDVRSVEAPAPPTSP